MAKSYKLWLEIEELEDGDPTGNDLGMLPDSLGEFKGRGALRQAIKHAATIADVFATYPDSSDFVANSEIILRREREQELKKSRNIPRQGKGSRDELAGG